MKTILSIYNNLLTLYHHSSETQFYSFFKMSKCFHTVLEILLEFSNIFRDVISLSLYEIVNFFINYSLF